MSVLNDTWRFLVQRRLLPVVIILIAAAAAVPMLLSSEPAPPPAAPEVAVKADKQAVLATDPIVAPAADGDRAGRRKVLGARKDPFKPKATPTPEPKPSAAKATDTETAAAPTTGGDTGSVGGSPAPDSGTPVVPGTTPPKKKTYELYELTVRFGSTSADVKRRDVKRLQALPSAGHPVLIYLGVLDDKKTSVFMLDSGVVAQGDGVCKPSRTTCETIHIQEGETEFFDVTGANGETAVRSTSSTSSRSARRPRRTPSRPRPRRRASRRQGKQILRARIAGDGPLRYRYDKKSGRLEKLSHKAYKSVVAKAAKAARAHF